MYYLVYNNSCLCCCCCCPQLALSDHTTTTITTTTTCRILTRGKGVEAHRTRLRVIYPSVAPRRPRNSSRPPRFSPPSLFFQGQKVSDVLTGYMSPTDRRVVADRATLLGVYARVYVCFLSPAFFFFYIIVAPRSRAELISISPARCDVRSSRWRLRASPSRPSYVDIFVAFARRESADDYRWRERRETLSRSCSSWSRSGMRDVNFEDRGSSRARMRGDSALRRRCAELNHPPVFDMFR